MSQGGEERKRILHMIMANGKQAVTLGEIMGATLIPAATVKRVVQELLDEEVIVEARAGRREEVEAPSLEVVYAGA